MKASTAFPYHPFWLGWNPSRGPITVLPEQFGSSRCQIFGRQSRLRMKTCWGGMNPGWQRSIFTHFVSCAAAADAVAEWPGELGMQKSWAAGCNQPCPRSTAGLLLPLAVPTAARREGGLTWRSKAPLPPSERCWSKSASFGKHLICSRDVGNQCIIYGWISLHL